MLNVGQSVAGYRLEEKLGEDALAATWRVASRSGVPHVLRVLTVRAPAFRERFLRGASAQVGLAHPNLVRVLGVVEVGEQPGVITEYVPGTDLGHWIAKGPHDPTVVLGVFVGMLRGVGAAHAAGLVHRNLKPSKVLLQESSHGPLAKINDFTLGKVTDGDGGQALTQVGITFGTPTYMPPEQFRGVGDVDPRADLFALGALLYEMLAGRRAFEGTDLMDLYKAVSGSRYRPLRDLRPDLPESLERLVDALLSPDPAGRPLTAGQALDAMRADEAMSRLLPPGARTPSLHPGGPTLAPHADLGDADSESESGAIRRRFQPPRPPSDAGATASPKTMDPAARASQADTRPPSDRRDARTLPPEQVFKPLPTEPGSPDDPAVLRRQVTVALSVAGLLLILVAVLLIKILSA